MPYKVWREELGGIKGMEAGIGAACVLLLAWAEAETPQLGEEESWRDIVLLANCMRMRECNE